MNSHLSKISLGLAVVAGAWAPQEAAALGGGHYPCVLDGRSVLRHNGDLPQTVWLGRF